LKIDSSKLDEIQKNGLGTSFTDLGNKATKQYYATDLYSLLYNLLHSHRDKYNV